jgi:formate/nitrite transporter FocA (FNT family)
LTRQKVRLWAVVLCSNLLGAATFAAAVVHAEILSPTALDLLLGRVSRELGYRFWTVAFKGVFGGWLVALIAWLVEASRDTTSQIIAIWILAFLIPVGGLMHSVADSSEVLMSLFAGESSWPQYLGDFLLPPR